MPSLLDSLTDVEHARTVTGRPLISGTFPSGEHDRIWRDFRAEHRRTGWWPVLGWSAAEAAELSRRWDMGPHGEALLDSLRDVDAAQRVAELVEATADLRDDDTEPPETATPRTHAPHTSRHPPTSVLLVPANAGHEVLAHVPGILPIMNNWAGGPSHPDLLYADHLLTLRHWEQTWGAQLYFCRGADLELAVDRPPRDPLAAAACAIEQSAYCYDLFQKISDVARDQAPGAHWSFWWD